MVSTRPNALEIFFLKSKIQSLPSGKTSNGTAFNNQLLNIHCMPVTVLHAAKTKEKESCLVLSQGAYVIRERRSSRTNHDS